MREHIISLFCLLFSLVAFASTGYTLRCHWWLAGASFACCSRFCLSMQMQQVSTPVRMRSHRGGLGKSPLRLLLGSTGCCSNTNSPGTRIIQAHLPTPQASIAVESVAKTCRFTRFHPPGQIKRLLMHTGISHYRYPGVPVYCIPVLPVPPFEY